MGLGIVKGIGNLLGDGASMHDIVNGIPRAAVAGAGAPPPEPTSPSALPARQIDANEALRHGPYGAVLTQAMADRQMVNDLLGRLTETERKMLPEVKETADALFARVVALAAALQRIEGPAGATRLPAIDERLAQIEKEPADSGDRQRRLNLLRRQREMLAELVQSRAKLLGQYESAGILLQNLALDLLKVRSSGLDSAMNGITSATQEARALSREIGYVLDAADELKKLGDQAGAKST
jgi:hypothetical protein